ncbi:MAG: hypothetical protein M3376_00665 [Actinomycetota bacterium]|nr:hypothetical protein [Actinomycetota bacterium]
MRHRLKHHANRPVLHWGLFTDAQMMPCAGLFAIAAGWFYAGGGGLAARTLGAALLLLPVGVALVDNRLGGVLAEQLRALVAWRRLPGVLEPRPEEKAHGYEMSVDEEGQRALERERLEHVDLETVFATES